MKAIISLIRKQKGQALVEFALILPLLVLLVFGLVEFGRAMYIKNMLNNAARAASRVAVVTPNMTDRSYTFSVAPDAADPVKKMIYDEMYYVDKATATASVDILEQSGTAKAVSGNTVKVTVTCNFNSVVPKMIAIANTLTGEASMRYE